MKTSQLTLTTLAALAFAFALPSAAVDLSASPETIAAEKADWIERLSEKQRDFANAKARYAQAQASYQRMRTRNTSRGNKRSQSVAELQNAETALADAEADLEATLADARRQGVPPGWIRDANIESSASPAANN
jgi:multidrug resistance efflux pump